MGIFDCFSEALLPVLITQHAKCSWLGQGLSDITRPTQRAGCSSCTASPSNLKASLGAVMLIFGLHIVDTVSTSPGLWQNEEDVSETRFVLSSCIDLFCAGICSQLLCFGPPWLLRFLCGAGTSCLAGVKSFVSFIIGSQRAQNEGGRGQTVISRLSGSKPRSSFHTLRSGEIQKSVLTRGYF